MAGVTPTAGNVVFFGDMGGNFYALDSDSGKTLFQQDMGGALAGGVITYDTGSGQKVAVSTGLTSKIWPTPKSTAKIQVLALQ
jgi:outer membrane protein assembly factor BamB